MASKKLKRFRVKKFSKKKEESERGHKENAFLKRQHNKKAFQSSKQVVFSLLGNRVERTKRGKGKPSSGWLSAMQREEGGKYSNANSLYFFHTKV